MSHNNDPFEADRQDSEICIEDFLATVDTISHSPTMKHPKYRNSKSTSILSSTRSCGDNTNQNQTRTRSQSPPKWQHAKTYHYNPSTRASTPPSAKKIPKKKGTWNLNPFTNYTNHGVIPNVNNALEQAVNTLMYLYEVLIPNMINTSSHLNNTLQDIDDQLIPQLMKTMKMIQDVTKNVNDFLRFLKVVIVILMAMAINYLYKHTEFVLIVILIAFFSMDTLNIWRERYFETVDDERIINGGMVKITGNKSRLNKMWKDSGLKDVMNKEKYLNKYGQVIKKNKMYESVLIKCENGERVWIPVRACVV